MRLDSLNTHNLFVFSFVRSFASGRGFEPISRRRALRLNCRGPTYSPEKSVCTAAGSSKRLNSNRLACALRAEQSFEGVGLGPLGFPD